MNLLSTSLTPTQHQEKETLHCVAPNDLTLREVGIEFDFSECHTNWHLYSC